MGNVLRFAPVIRVSTEQQEKKGESLLTQRKQITEFVNSIPDAVIPDYCWKYIGQESATSGQERLLLDKLLSDSSKGIFDAVICVDASRWSRDNLKSKEGLNILKANGIRFFIGTTEYDLYDPAQNLFLGMSAEIGEFQARQQALKSIQNRINRAKRGIPTVGRLPYGRIYDNPKTRNVIVDEPKQKLILDAVKRYIKGDKLEDIAKDVGLHKSFLWKVFKNNLGTDWHLSFINRKVNVNEQVVIKVPPLIDDKELIRAVNERNRINTLYVRGHRKYTYLLSGYLFCKRCGSKMQGSTNRHGRFRKYYYHFRHRVDKCGYQGMIPATELENALLIKLVQTFGDPQMTEQALLRWTPNPERREELEKEQSELNTNLKNVQSEINTIIHKIGKEIITDEDARPVILDLKTDKKRITDRLSVIKSELDSMPDLKKLRQASKFASKVIAQVTKDNPKLIFKRSDAWKRKLIEKAFSGTDISGNRLGIYVDSTDKKGVFTYTIRGLFGTTVEAIPMTDDELIRAFHLDPDDEGSLNNIRSNFSVIRTEELINAVYVIDGTL